MGNMAKRARVNEWGMQPTCLGLFMVMLMSLSSAAVAATGGKLVDAHWQIHDPDSEILVDHEVWDTLLGRYLVTQADDGLARFDYGEVSDEDRDGLDDYVESLEQVTVSKLNRAEQKAFWINLYNAFTVKLVVRAYPVRSIRNIGGGVFSPGPWADKKYRVTVEGRKLTLDDIEHGILRPVFQDNLVHYGVNCASVGCPNLVAKAYTGEMVDQMLQDNAAAYIRSPRGIRKVDGRRVWVSSIYSWFQEDFGGNGAGVIVHLKEYGGAETARLLENVQRLGGHDYDWSLNDQTGGEADE